MYLKCNEKRHQVYDYTNDDSGSYSDGRNIDHTIGPDALAGVGGYYGEGGIQEYAFGTENWAFSEYDQFITRMLQSNLTDAELQQELQDFQNYITSEAKTYYVDGTYPPVNTPPSVVTTSPADGTKNVKLDLNIEITFDEDVNISLADLDVTGSKSGSIDGSLSYDPSTFVATFDPTSSFSPTETVTVVVRAP